MESAVLAKLGAIAYHGCTRSNPQADESVAVIGMGPIGLFSALFHLNSTARVAVADLSASRLALASTLGLETVSITDDLVSAFKSIFPDGADVVVDCTGHPPVLNACLSLARDLPWDDSWKRGSRLLVQGSYAASMELDYDMAFQREIQVLLTRDHQRRDLITVLDWMNEIAVPYGKILTELRPFRAAPDAFRDLLEHKDRYLTIGLDWRVMH